ncbi:MAG: c-type cytochrome [Gammaproteobacteria bacterium]
MFSLARPVFSMLLLSVLGAASSMAAEPPPEVALCATCHGAAAPSPYASVPTIHGLPAAVLDNALYDFRATIRPCRKVDCTGVADCPETDFCDIVARLSDEQIAGLAHWYARQPYAPAGEPWDRALAARGSVLHAAHCESCHAGGGLSPVEEASILRGQRKAYLRLAMEDFHQERRVAVAEMHASIEGFTDADVAALIEFYASPLD